MFCPNCGSQLPDGSAFCSSCGAQLGGAQAPQQPVQQYQPPQYQQPQMAQQQWQQSAAPKKKLSTGAIIAIVAVAALVLLRAGSALTIAVLAAAAVAVPIVFGILRKKKALIFVGAGVLACIIIGVVVSMVRGGAFEERGLKGADVAPQTIIDNEIVTVRVTGLTYTKGGYYDDYYPYSIGMEITNHTNQDLHPYAAEFYINGDGTMFNTFYSDIPAGQTVSGDHVFAFFWDNTKIKTIGMVLEFRKPGTTTSRFTSERIELKTTLADQ